MGEAMKIDFKKRIVVIAVSFTVGGLLLLLVRENGGRIAAEEKLKDIQYKVTSMRSQKDDAIMDLQAQVSSLQAKLQEAAESQTALLDQKKTEIDALNIQMKDSSDKYETTLKQKDENIGKLDVKSKEEAAKYSDSLKEKNQPLCIKKWRCLNPKTWLARKIRTNFSLILKSPAARFVLFHKNWKRIKNSRRLWNRKNL